MGSRKDHKPYKAKIIQSVFNDLGISLSPEEFINSHIAYKSIFEFTRKIRTCDETGIFDSALDFIKQVVVKHDKAIDKYTIAQAIVAGVAFNFGSIRAMALRDNFKLFKDPDPFQTAPHLHQEKPYTGKSYFRWSKLFRKAFQHAIAIFYEDPMTLDARNPFRTYMLPTDEDKPFFTSPCADIGREVHQVAKGHRDYNNISDEIGTRMIISSDLLDRNMLSSQKRFYQETQMLGLDKDFYNDLSLGKRKHFIHTSEKRQQLMDSVKYPLLKGYVSELEKLLARENHIITEEQQAEIRVMAESFGVVETQQKEAISLISEMKQIIFDYEESTNDIVTQTDIDKLITKFSEN